MAKNKKICREFRELDFNQLVVNEHDPSISGFKEVNSNIVLSIENYGILEPLIVAGPDHKQDVGDDLFFILDGHERFKAIEKINQKESSEKINLIPCIVLDVPCDKFNLAFYRVVLGMRDVNQEEVEVKRFTLASLLNFQSKHMKIDPSKISGCMSKMLSINERTARCYNHVYCDGIRELRDAVCYKKSDGKAHITLSDADLIAGKDKETQKKILDKINKGEKLKDVLEEFSEKKEEIKEPNPNLDDEIIDDLVKILSSPAGKGAAQDEVIQKLIKKNGGSTEQQ